MDRARSGRALITMIKDGQRHHFDRPERHGHAGRRLRALDQARTWCGWCVPKVQKHVQPHRIRTSLVYVQRLSALFHTLSGIPVILWRWRTEMHAESRVRMGWVATLIYLLPYPSLTYVNDFPLLSHSHLLIHTNDLLQRFTSTSFTYTYEQPRQEKSRGDARASAWRACAHLRPREESWSPLP